MQEQSLLSGRHDSLQPVSLPRHGNAKPGQPEHPSRIIPQ